jgi:hypothetical protein
VNPDRKGAVKEVRQRQLEIVALEKKLTGEQLTCSSGANIWILCFAGSGKINLKPLFQEDSTLKVRASDRIRPDRDPLQESGEPHPLLEQTAPGGE